MEEDIKILEKYIEWVKKEGIEVCGMEKELPALENILKENENLKQAIEINKNLYEEVCNKNKELEEENESLVKQYEYQGAKMVNEYMSFKNVKKLFIPKSKVKEKIEEIKRI